jgi:hypothetical protein
VNIEKIMRDTDNWILELLNGFKLELTDIVQLIEDKKRKKALKAAKNLHAKIENWEDAHSQRLAEWEDELDKQQGSDGVGQA